MSESENLAAATLEKREAGLGTGYLSESSPTRFGENPPDVLAFRVKNQFESTKKTKLILAFRIKN